MPVRVLQELATSLMRPRRLDSFAYVGHHQYFLTICTHQRARWFIDGQVVRDVTQQFLRTAAVEGFEILVYCFMPDHLHMLASGDTQSADLRRFVRIAKQRSGFAFKRLHGQGLWQDSYFDRTLRENETVTAAIRYIVANPVRAGLVSSPADYPQWGSQVYSRDDILDFISTECRV